MPGRNIALQWSSAGLVALVTIAAVAVALWPTLASLAAHWASIHDYQHGYLIAAIAGGWIALTARSVWSDPPVPQAGSIVLLVALLFAWLVAFNANSAMVCQMLLPLVAWTAVLGAAGAGVARRMVWPIGFLYFATPIWDHFVPVLQWLSVRSTEGMLALIGVTAEVSEYRVTIPEGSFQIIEGCSGKRYFMVSLAVAVLAAAVNGIQGWRRLGFVVTAGLLSMIANWIRILTVILSGHLTDMRHYFVAVEHKTLGNVIFVILLLALFLFARLLDGRSVGQQASGSGPAALQVAATGTAARLAWLPVVLLGAILAITQARAAVLVDPPQLGSLPLATGEWLGPFPAGPGWHPEFDGPTAERRAAYSSGRGRVELYVNVYGEQRQGEELVGWGNTLIAPGAWQRAWPARTVMVSGQLASFEARGPGGRKWVIAYVYRVGGFTTSSALAAQLTYGIKSMLRPIPAGVIALAVRCDTNCEAARALVESFWDDVSAEILATVPKRPGTGDST